MMEISNKNVSLGNPSSNNSMDYKANGLKLYLQKDNKIVNLQAEDIVNLCRCNFKLLLVDDSDFNLVVLK